MLVSHDFANVQLLNLPVRLSESVPVSLEVREQDRDLRDQLGDCKRRDAIACQADGRSAWQPETPTNGNALRRAQSSCVDYPSGQDGAGDSGAEGAALGQCETYSYYSGTDGILLDEFAEHRVRCQRPTLELALSGVGI